MFHAGEYGILSEAWSKIDSARCSAGEIIDDPLETSFPFSLRQLLNFLKFWNYSSFSLNVHLLQIREISINKISILNATKFYLLLYFKKT